MNTMRNMLVLLAVMSVTAVAVEPAFAGSGEKGRCHRHHCYRRHHQGGARGENGGRNKQAIQRESNTPTAAPVVPAR